jgi:hypothetical protein
MNFDEHRTIKFIAAVDEGDVSKCAKSQFTYLQNITTINIIRFYIKLNANQ